MPELLPCPHCGHDVSFKYDLEYAIRGIYCGCCHSLTMYTNIEVRPKDTMGETAERYADRWNRRFKE